MTFRIPTLDEAREEARTVVAQSLGALSLPRFSNARILAEGIAGYLYQHFGFQKEISNQILPDTATSFLERHAAVWGIDRVPASIASGTVTFSGAAGLAIPTGTTLTTAAGRYRVSTGGSFTGSTLTVAAESIDAGAALNADAGDALTLEEAIAGVDATATVVTMDGGADAETDDALRARLLARHRQPPHGGAQHDYVAWAKTVAGVTRVWVYPNEQGTGTVVVRFMMTGFPTPTDEANVLAAINAVRPVTADVYAISPIAQPIDITITGLNPDTPEVRTAIEAELTDMFYRRAVPGGTTSLSWIAEAVSLAAGESAHVLSVPSADIAATSVGHLATLGTVTYA